jgi:hypothetical protein
MATPAGWRWSVEDGRGGQAGKPGQLRGRWLVCVGGSDACVALLPLWSRRGGLREDADPSR